MTSEHKTFGPMHGESVPRHQFVGRSGRDDELIVSTYEIRERDDDGLPLPGVESRLAVEFYRPVSGVTSAWLTAEEAGWLRDALDEFISTPRGQ